MTCPKCDGDVEWVTTSGGTGYVCKCDSCGYVDVWA